MKIAGETPYETDLNVWMELEKGLKDGKPYQTNNSYILKDRSDTINGKIFSMPKYKNVKPVINCILGLPIGEIAQETSNANLTPGNDLEYFENIQKRKIEIEKIAAVFELNGLGSPRSAEEKKLKTMIIQKIFQTTSQTEIDKMPYTALNNFRIDLEELFKQLLEREDKIEFVEKYDLVILG